MLASVVLNKAAALLLDATFVRWTESELIGYLNLAQREIARVLPDSTATRATITAVAGSRQSLPADALSLLTVEKNTGGKAIYYADGNALDLFDSSWRTATATALADDWVYFGETEPLAFFLSPPAIAGNQIDLLYSKYPTTITANTDALTVSDEYESVLIDYVLARALSKDSEYADSNKADSHLQAFFIGLGVDDRPKKNQKKRVEGKA